MSGTTGPTFFLLKGASCKKSYTDGYLMKHGMKPGSSIIMTENAYMTDDAWLKVSMALVKGYRLLPYIKENPHWYVAELFDGFKSHENVLKAHELRFDAKIISLKEESNSSHVNQGYDQLVAKNDKKNAAESLYDQRKAKKWVTGKTTINQYDLVHTAMRLVRATDSKTWVTSFERVNLHPWTRKEFPAFCKKIAGHLRAGDTFKDDHVDPTAEEKFALLPSFWHGMLPAERRVVMTVLQSHAFQYTAPCLQMLHNECKLPYSQMNDVRVCVLVSREHPGCLDFDIKNLITRADVDLPPPDEVLESTTGKVSLNDNLYHLMLIPKDDAGNPIITGEQLFDHMCRFRNMKHASAKGKGLVDEDDVPPLEPSQELGVHLYDDSLKHIQPTAYDLRRGAILKDYIGNNALRKTAKRKLNSFGYIVGNSGVVNSEENMRRMREQLVMADSVAEISRLEEEDKEKEKREKNKVHDKKAPDAVTKLEGKGRVVAKLTVKEIEAILYTVYNITLGGSKRKPDFVKALENEMASNICKYEDYLRLLASATKDIDDVIVDPPVLPAIEYVGMVEEVETEQEEEIASTEILEAEDAEATPDSEDDDVDVGEKEVDMMVENNDDVIYDGVNEGNWDTDIVDANVIGTSNVIDKGNIIDESMLDHGVRLSRKKCIPNRLRECWF